MNDVLLKATVPGIRAFAAITTNLVEDARQRHNCYPTAIAALGRTMTGALLLAANLKTEESITIRVTGDGPLEEIVVDADNHGNVRGYVNNPQTHLPLKNEKLDVGGAIGKGHIHVTRFTGLKAPFTGSIELVSGEIAEDIAQYLLFSEQTPSTIILGVKVQPDLTVTAAGGMLIQALPDAEEEIIEKIENNISQLPSITAMLEAGLDAQGMIEKAFAGLPILYGGETPLKFQCRCSRDRVEKMLISLGEEELINLLNEQKAEIKCHFCSQFYHFNQNELDALLQEVRRMQKTL
ncbi:MAG: hslO [Firmicutes bacterium]|nr:hslO [Bacillota bacterium]